MKRWAHYFDVPSMGKTGRSLVVGEVVETGEVIAEHVGYRFYGNVTQSSLYRLARLVGILLPAPRKPSQYIADK